MRRRTYTTTVVLTLLIVITSFYTLPYYVTKPGTAQELEPIVEVSGGDKAEGSFMLTTVRMGKANLYSYLIAKWNDYYEIYPEKTIRYEDEDEEEYNIRQQFLMDNSKNHAIKVAYEKAGKTYNYQYLGVYVLDVREGMPAAEYLKAGDQIIQVDDVKFKSSQEFIDYVAKKKVGETVELVFKREETENRATIAIQSFKDNPKQSGIGITLNDYTRIVTTPKITIHSEQIGGPSAGLMFTLEIYNQLTPGDLTKGYKIAGTGTMNKDGVVGAIGGISQKVVAADKSGAEIFFAPNEKGAENSNYKEAVKAAKDIKTDMKIIPVDTFSEALAYLEKLDEK